MKHIPKTGSDMLDISALQEHEYEAWLPLASAYMAFYKTVRRPDEYERLWQRLHSGSGLCSFGARIDGSLVGFTHYFFHASCWSEDVCYLQDLFVDPDARAQGIGRSLIQSVKDRARQANAPRLYWLTQNHNDVARRLYDQLATHSGFIRYEINLG